MLLFLQLFQNLGWKVLQSLLMKPLVAVAMFKGWEAGSAGREQNERPHFHGVEERLESAKKKGKDRTNERRCFSNQQAPI